MKKGDIIELKISGIDYPSKAYAYYNNDNRKYYANINLAPNHKIKASIGKIKNNKVELRNIEILENPKESKKPFCEHFNRCGGCNFQYLDYESQIELKTNFVIKLIENEIKNRNYLKLDTIKMERLDSYRNKMEFSFGNEYKGGETIMGLHKKNSFHDIVRVDSCQLMDNDFRTISTYTNNYFIENKTSFYHRLSHKGFLRNLVIRKGEKTKELLINLVTSSQNYDQNLIENWKNGLLNLKLDKNIKVILHTFNDSKSDSVQSDKELLLYGDSRDITEILFDLSFNISPYSFFQTNSFGVEKLYQVVKDFLKEIKENKKDIIVYDLFSGTGTIGQIVSKDCKYVYGIEIVEEAVKKANENVVKNNIDNAKFIAGDVFEKLDKLEEKPDLLILDPPRVGIGEKTIDKLIKYEVENIIYVSCNPKTLAQDLKFFELNNYNLKKIRCVDMFPHTSHIETVALLSKLDVNNHIEVEIELN